MSDDYVREWLLQELGLREPRLDRLASRLHELGLPGLAEYGVYVQHCTDRRAELRRIASLVTCPETHFFRHPAQFEMLTRRMLPEIARHARTRANLHLWSAGCSTGAEAYSLAIGVRESEQASRFGFTLVGTDVNPEAIAAAREGLFREWELRGLPIALRMRYFTPEGPLWRLHDSIRHMVRFEVGNLLTDVYPVNCDIIMCRNVLVHFDSLKAATVVRRLAASLTPTGYLMLGYAEAGVGHTCPDLVSHNPTSASFQRRPAAVRAREPAAPRQIARPRQQPIVPVAVPVPMDAGNPYDLALTLLDAGRRAEAARELRRAIFLNHQHAAAHYYLGLVEHLQGKVANARRSYRTVVRLLGARPDNEPVMGLPEYTNYELDKLARIQLEQLSE